MSHLLRSASLTSVVFPFTSILSLSLSLGTVSTLGPRPEGFRNTVGRESQWTNTSSVTKRGKCLVSPKSVNFDPLITDSIHSQQTVYSLNFELFQLTTRVKEYRLLNVNVLILWLMTTRKNYRTERVNRSFYLHPCLLYRGKRIHRYPEGKVIFLNGLSFFFQNSITFTTTIEIFHFYPTYFK